MSDWSKDRYDEQGVVWEVWYKQAIPVFFGTEQECDDFIASKS